ncbi:MAG: type VI secretion system ATPase TssH, partial [Candidatus Krumholzibacteria bacterium]|nr:type VI secretion system ATPase TssH [Candidatus Krumholzibacteria bacterium]
MRFDRFTLKAQEAVSAAQEIAFKRNNTETTPLHLLSALLQQEEGIVLPIIKKMGIDHAALDQGISSGVLSLPRLEKGIADARPSLELQDLLRRSMDEAEQLHDEYVSTEHLLLALEEDGGQAGRLMKVTGVTRETILRALTDVRGSQRVTDHNPESKYRALKRFTVDFVRLAHMGKLDPVIGRDEEIRRVSQVLTRRTKNNPVLIGEPGVGKT